MIPVRRLAAAAAVAAALIGAAAVGVLPASPASAETGVNVDDVCPATRAGESPRINMLILLDTSGSLRTNDPANLRSAGTRDALQVLESLSSQFSGADTDARIEVTVDTFDQRYFRQHGWLSARGVYGRLGGAIEDIASDDGSYTDYGEALRGAWSRFAARADDCNLLIWFTDGEHATAADAEGEQRELLQLCSSPEMQSLRDHVWVGAVQLNTGDASSSRLRYLYGEDDASGGALDCVNPLRGRIYDDFDPTRLNRVLSELISTSTGETDPTVEPPLPPVKRPPPPEFESCTGGDGSRERPCVVPFDLGPRIESFRAFVDLTFIERGIANPDSVLVTLRSPGGAHSPSIGGSGDIRPGEHIGQYVRVDPFAFFARSQYPSDLQIVGHQAAEQLVNPGQWQWQWEGSWQLRFFGDTPEARADARKAAAVVRFQTTDRPATDSMGIDANAALSGFVRNYPQGYEDVELRVRPDAADRQSVYATRDSLTDEPLDVVGDDRRFELPGFLDHLVFWDSEEVWDVGEGGGNGKNLREAIDKRGGLVAVAVLNQHFKYGGLPEPLEWGRDIGGYQLTEVELQTLQKMLDGRDRVPEVRKMVEDPDTVWLPSGVTLGAPEVTQGAPEVADGVVSFPVTAVPGELAGVLALEETSMAVLDAEPVQDAMPTTPDSAAAGGPETPRIEADPWSCEVPSASSHTGGEFACPSLRLSIDVDQDTELAAALSVDVAEQPGTADALLEGLWFPPGSQEGEHLSALLGERIAQERQPVRLESDRFTVREVVGPSGVALGAPEVAGKVVSFPVTATPGELSGVLALDETSVAVLDAAPAMSGTAAAAGSETPRIEADPWSCEVPNASSHTDGEFACPLLQLSIDVDRETELAVALSMDVAERPGAAEQQSVRLESDRFIVERPPRPVEKFWPMLAVLVAAALVARVFVAWRLRPWRPIGSPDFVTVPLHSDDSLEHAPTLAGTRRDICMDLTRRKASTVIGGVTLRSSWLPLLLGRRPRLTASAASGDCIGPKGCAPLRSGRCRAHVGTDLSGGWTVDATADEERLIVWDLPTDPQEAQDRLDDAAREAAPRLRAHRESHGAVHAQQEAEGPDTSDMGDSDVGDAGVPHGDPLADDDQYEPDHDTDPFGRPT